MKKTLLPLILLVVALKMQGQVGINTTTPQATFDIVGVPATVTAADGLIAPRLTRAQLIAKTAYGSNQQGAIVYVTDTTGTTNATTVKVTAVGYYYFDGTLWQAIGGTPVIPTEPWNVQGSSTSATANGQNIYQNGNVAIGTLAADPASTEKLYVKGNTLFNDPNKTGAVGGSLIFNSNGIVSEVYSKAANSDFGDGNDRAYLATLSDPANGIKPNTEIFAGNNASGQKVGAKVQLNADKTNKPTGRGYLDMYAYTYNSTTANDGTNTYVGIDEDGLKIGVLRGTDLVYDGYNGITSAAGIKSDTYYLPKTLPTTGQVLTFDTSTGGGIAATVVKTKWAAPTITVSNGLSKDATSGDIQLGGALSKATTLTTTAANTLAVAGLVADNTVSNLVAVDGSGVLKTIAKTSLAFNIWNKQTTTSAATALGDDVYHTGKVAIGTTNADALASSMLFVKGGDIETTGKFISGTSQYADYVFEKYFTGDSKINAKYKFRPLSEVKDFVAKNHHLPGVTPINDLAKTSTGYKVDITQLSIQQLEKLEELYLHVIEQQEIIKKQNDRIKALEDKLEKLLK